MLHRDSGPCPTIPQGGEPSHPGRSRSRDAFHPERPARLHVDLPGRGVLAAADRLHGDRPHRSEVQLPGEAPPNVGTVAEPLIGLTGEEGCRYALWLFALGHGFVTTGSDVTFLQAGAAAGLREAEETVCNPAK